MPVSENNFKFLENCLDKKTVDYFNIGLYPEKASPPILNKDSLYEELSKLLGIEKEKLFKISYSEAFHNAFSCIKWKRKYKKSFDTLDPIHTNEPYLINLYNLFFNHLIRDNATSDLAMSLSLFISNAYIPYLFLLLLEIPQDWLLINSDFFSSEIFYLKTGHKQSFQKEGNNIKNLNYFILRIEWNNFLTKLVKGNKELIKIKKLFFCNALIHVLRYELALLKTPAELTDLPNKLPDLVSSKYLRERIALSRNKTNYEYYFALLLGIYLNSDLRTKEIDEYLEKFSQIYKQNHSLDNFEKLFTKWQVREILRQPKSLTPIFALLLTMRENSGEEMARLFYEFKDYASKNINNLNTNGEKRILLLNYFLPYSYIDNNTIILKPKTETSLTIDERKDSSFIQYETGKEIIIINLLYLLFNNLNTYNYREINEEDKASFDCIQVNEVNGRISQLYYPYLKQDGDWLIVKDRFESELDIRMKVFMSNLRHDILHHLDPSINSNKEITEYLESQEESDRNKEVKSYSKSILRNLRIVRNQLKTALSEYDRKGEFFNFKEKIKDFISAIPIHRRVSLELNLHKIPDDLKFYFIGDGGILFYRMLENIINNAMVHGFDSCKKDLGYQPSICIEAQTEDELVTLRIKNNGHPFPENFTIDNYRTSGITNKSGHTGLGGHQINKIANLHKGNLDITSDENWNCIIEIKFNI